MTKVAVANGTGKLNANKTKSEGREHGTRWKTGIPGLLTPDLVRSYGAKGFNLEQIADIIGCDRTSVVNAINADEELLIAWRQGNAQLLDITTSALIETIKDKNIATIIYTTKAKFGWCEEQYKIGKQLEKTESPRVMIYLPDNSRDTLLDGKMAVEIE